MESFVGSGSGGPSALLLEGPAGIGKTTLWHTGLSLARARGHRVLSCRAAEAEARLLRARTGGDLPRPVLLRLHRISGGNPLFALEIARALSGQGSGRRLANRSRFRGISSSCLRRYRPVPP